ncbi:hypothetical protein [Pseudomonas amygdali]|uniref:Uncharacterized protein n=1 Tax=Pseudomonas amygdali pv. lachrymans str. M301315 TaxID=629260 RepID=A0AAD0V9E3_PSEAV|nr:hypothetical protein [Pseudomonas amygdali]AXH59855.1 hypothetical protein PLA107_032030 [Pseudomonas amygdali pv. lachrymans str. M301315]RMT05871.1 hypothetical protein ALP54_03735 [Pseudomonas amygdali pv. lachrymans]
MLSAQQISRQLLGRTLSTEEALAHRDRLGHRDSHQFIDDIIFVSGLLNPIDPKLESAATRYDRGVEVLIDLLNLAGSPTRTKMVNNIQSAFFADVRSGALVSDSIPPSQRLALINLFIAFQSRSPLAALHLLSRGMDKGRNDRIYEILNPHIDKQLIIETAAQTRRVDLLFTRSRWLDCLPHLPSKFRDAHLAGDLGL